MRKKLKGFNYITGISLSVAVCLLLIFIYSIKEEGPPPPYGPALQISNNKDAADSFQFAFLADTHGRWGVFKPIMKEITNNGYAFAVIGGDIVRIGSEDAYRFFFKELAGVRGNTPIFFVPGNHDVFNEHVKYNLKNYRKYCGHDYYWFSRGNAAFVVLNETLTGKRINKRQLRWLKNTLREVKGNFTHICVFMHIPPFDPREGENYCLPEMRGKRLMQLMEEFEVDYVFCGHIHCYFKEVINGVTYIISGGAGGTLKCPDGFYHYVRVSVRGEEIVDSVIKVKKNWWLELTGEIKYYIHSMRSFFRSFHTGELSNPSSSFSPTD
jgi:3',5'-cyclic AMP phosphodiesterase CpdA